MKPSDRRQHARISLTAELAEPVEITVLKHVPDQDPRQASHLKAHHIPAIIANISAGGMAIVAFGGKDVFADEVRIQLVTTIFGQDKTTVEGNIVHLRDREGVQTFGLRFNSIHKSIRDRIDHLVDDYSDCETRISLRIPEVCVGRACHFFGLCRKDQKQVSAK
ncbi:MAG: PilZ domain-containing protein [Elusimicrobia bacterium]|nr:PilZ domain-containing protein [Elusimicrobiota bacterium]